MDALVLLFAMFAMATSSAGATWCVCRSDLSDTVLQKTLDYACGAGADCTPILQNGACYNPNTVRSHCSYAVNSYFQKKGQAQGTCDFAGTASQVTADPSPSSTCPFPSSASPSGGTTTSPPSSSTTTPPSSTTTPPGSTTTPPGSTTTTPPGSTTTTPLLSPPGIIGGTGSLGPTGVNTDVNGAGFRPNAELGYFILSLISSCLVLLRG